MATGLLYLGLTYETAPLAVREAFRPDDQATKAILRRLASVAPGRCVLTTCERFELYAHADDADPIEWTNRVAGWFHVPAALLARHVYLVRGMPVASHLLRVAAGLESRVPGEPQILGQVRDAYMLATDERSLDPILSALCRAAIRTGKRVRHETALNRSGRSIATLAAERATRRSPAGVVVVGSGRLARDVTEELARRRVGSITLVARNEARAGRIAEAFHAGVEPMTRLRDVLLGAGAAVTCTSSSRFVIDTKALRGRRSGPLELIDLSMPRNVDPDARLLPDVTLSDLDGLLSGDRGCHADATAATGIVSDELRRFRVWWSGRRAIPQIRALYHRAQSQGGARTRRERQALHERIVRAKQSVDFGGARA